MLTVEYQTTFMTLSTEEWFFLAAIGQGASLSGALGDASLTGGLDAAAALTRFVSHRVIVDFIDQ